MLNVETPSVLSMTNIFMLMTCLLKVVRYSIGQKMSNFTFDARSQQWLVQLPQKFM